MATPIRMLLIIGCCFCVPGVKKHEFAEGLTYQEKEWLASVINDAIDKGQGEYDPDDYED
eukprot:scaffold127045_cov47-Prasinocladus_malaysianus.AAC.2